MHFTHTRRVIFAHWLSLSTHYEVLREASDRFRVSHVVRGLFWPWLHAAARLQVSSAFLRRSATSKAWTAWRAAFARMTMQRGFAHALQARNRGRIFYAWHALRESLALRREAHYLAWRRAFTLKVRVRSWVQSRVLRSLKAIVGARKEQTILAQNTLEPKFALARARRTLQESWDEWKSKAEVRFESNFLRMVEAWRRSDTCTHADALRSLITMLCLADSQRSLWRVCCSSV